MSYLIELYGEPANSFWMDFFLGLFIVPIACYFICFRGCIKDFFVSDRDSLYSHLSRKQRKIEEKREKSRKKKTKDTRTLKEQFIAWLLCKSYKDEQKKRGFKWFVRFNYFYLVLHAICCAVAFFALFITPLRYYFQVFVIIKSLHVDAILFLITSFDNLIYTLKRKLSK